MSRSVDGLVVLIGTLQITPHAPGNDERTHRLAHRRTERAAGRRLAQQCLARLHGGDPMSFDTDRPGPAVWPSGTVGSISHSPTLVAAAVARSDHSLDGLGIDAEPVASLAPDLHAAVLTAGEQRSIRVRDQPGFTTLLFSAKESVFKACGRDGLELSDIEIEWSHERATCGALCAHVRDLPYRLDGRWVEHRGHFVTLVRRRST